MSGQNETLSTLMSKEELCWEEWTRIVAESKTDIVLATEILMVMKEKLRITNEEMKDYFELPNKKNFHKLLNISAGKRDMIIKENPEAITKIMTVSSFFVDALINHYEQVKC